MSANIQRASIPSVPCMQGWIIWMPRRTLYLFCRWHLPQYLVSWSTWTWRKWQWFVSQRTCKSRWRWKDSPVKETSRISWNLWQYRIIIHSWFATRWKCHMVDNICIRNHWEKTHWWILRICEEQKDCLWRQSTKMELSYQMLLTAEFMHKLFFEHYLKFKLVHKLLHPRARDSSRKYDV